MCCSGPRRRYAGAWLVSLALLWCAAAGAAEPAIPPLWFRGGQPTPQAIVLLAQMRAADYYGLRPEDYDAEALASKVQQLTAARNQDLATIAHLDRVLSATTLRFVTHLHSGRIDPRTTGFSTFKPHPPLDGPATLRRLAESTDPVAELHALEPPFLHYRLLQDALQRYRNLARQPGLTDLPPLGPRSLRLGDRYPGAPALRGLLRAVGDLNPGASGPGDELIVDAQLTTALQQFQTRHALPADGVLGAATFRALTTPLVQRVRQIELTLERWRWLAPFSTPPIIVNIPQFHLYAFRSTEDRVAQMLQMPVIVGRIFPRMRTPVFESEMRYLVFRPYWDVPASIVRNEMLASIRKSTDYLARNNLELVRGGGDDGRVVEPDAANIEALAAGQLRLRQRPGDDNALGLVKFVMPNDYRVYLHSTPEQHLFGATRRAYSHGCIRLSEPAQLALHVLQVSGGDWTAEAVAAAMHGSDARRVDLQKPIPVLVLYGTALAKEDGQLMFFDDIYGHDRRLEALLRRAPRDLAGM
jgi:murein L,D-transpeptidase YcbB/YkuD